MPNRTADGPPASAGTADSPRALAPSPENGAKRTVTAEVVKVLLHRRADRGMRMEEFASRCVRQGELHELVTTDQLETEEGARIDRVGFLGFVEISVAGVLDRGDIVLVDGVPMGTLLGFDACHFPNHYNVLIHTAWTLTGPEAGLRPGSQVSFRPPPSTDGDQGPGRP
ncbi:hypothetical protein GCM10011583_50200 [Streptomyces camponoticapitis]|uniref:DUF6917 domain-containing protein n=1 Tax=Streptomyces camponoticapitis TaxID=1616125 RepID=A0ABQ2EHV3_9ACTN|nr:hypothetical protein [Streptomyces camponoticapitis]GGK12089.1 hypothetical protein GCM10011583_50200 [Streptomyces camponoticapitis]